MPALSRPLSSCDPPHHHRGWQLTSESVYLLSGRLAPWFAGSAAVLCAIGLFLGFLVAPSDPHQGEHFRIAFLHQPSMWISVLIYILMAAASAYGLLRKQRVAAMLASSLAPTGALFAFLALWTGSLWGKPIWGTWWVWEARLATEMLVLFLFLGFIALHETIDDYRRADRACGLLALVGLVGLPLLYFSVYRWSLYYGTSNRSLSAPTDETSIIASGLFVMTSGLFAYTAAATLTRLRNEILKRERSSDWVLAHFRGQR
ncbi:MAG TPA: cytochrome c biogenesis protein CcsA [Aromatoleum sp.]|uniref:cytochrome c biogenesis protein CcsA n=1 Tax=Aromatoleum sp. TaxID=2307007 RepID=UPI002B49569A|nr:cytochrome c biogenesis protein CcsA [Aromatoleum sp.]HJV25468.1 cytochrome c biogenesis protein CcsA [Aromatoleum sp.]